MPIGSRQPRMRLLVVTIWLATMVRVWAATSSFIDVDGGKLYCEEAGSGPALVLLHDGLMHSVTWDPVWSGLSKRFHVIRYDRRGYGRSAPSTKPFVQTEDLKAVLDHFHVSRATVVGSSSGGGVAIDFAIGHPDRVDRLILMGSVLHGMIVTSHFDERGAKNNAPLKKGDVKAAARNWSEDRYQISGANKTARRALYDALVGSPQNLTNGGELEMRHMRPAIVRLQEIHIPTLILVGEKDIPDVQAFGGAIQAGISGSRRETVQGCGHLIQLERPTYLIARIDRFVAAYPHVELSEDLLRSFAGKYKLWAGVTIALRSTQLYFQAPAEAEIPLFPVGSSKVRFFMFSQDAEIEFVKDPKGNVVEAVIRGENGTVTRCPRIPDAV